MLFADSISKLSYGFLRKSGHALYSMCFFQQNAPLAFGRTLLWKWLKKSCLQCTLGPGHLKPGMCVWGGGLGGGVEGGLCIFLWFAKKKKSGPPSVFE